MLVDTLDGIQNLPSCDNTENKDGWNLNLQPQNWSRPKLYGQQNGHVFLYKYQFILSAIIFYHDSQASVRLTYLDMLDKFAISNTKQNMTSVRDYESYGLQ
jgi:hypothetical protein